MLSSSSISLRDRSAPLTIRASTRRHATPRPRVRRTTRGPARARRAAGHGRPCGRRAAAPRRSPARRAPTTVRRCGRARAARRSRPRARGDPCGSARAARRRPRAPPRGRASGLELPGLHRLHGFARVERRVDEVVCGGPRRRGQHLDGQVDRRSSASAASTIRRGAWRPSRCRSAGSTLRTVERRRRDPRIGRYLAHRGRIAEVPSNPKARIPLPIGSQETCGLGGRAALREVALDALREPAHPPKVKVERLGEGVPRLVGSRPRSRPPSAGHGSMLATLPRRRPRPARRPATRPTRPSGFDCPQRDTTS